MNPPIKTVLHRFLLDWAVWHLLLLQSNIFVDPASPQSLYCPEVSNSREASPVPEIYGPEENYAFLQMASAETFHTEAPSPFLHGSAHSEQP